jgi:hypothetical protein
MRRDDALQGEVAREQDRVRLEPNAPLGKEILEHLSRRQQLAIQRDGGVVAHDELRKSQRRSQHR